MRGDTSRRPSGVLRPRCSTEGWSSWTRVRERSPERKAEESWARRMKGAAEEGGGPGSSDRSWGTRSAPPPGQVAAARGREGPAESCREKELQAAGEEGARKDSSSRWGRPKGSEASSVRGSEEGPCEEAAASRSGAWSAGGSAPPAST